MNKQCKICQNDAPVLGNVPFDKGNENEANKIVPNGHEMIPYHRCLSCGFIFADAFDEWNHKMFTKYIYNDNFFKGLEGHGQSSRSEAQIEGMSSSYLDGLKLDTLIKQFQSTGFLKKHKSEMKILDFGSGGNPGDTAKALLDNDYQVMCHDPFAFISSADTLPRDFDIIYLIEVIEHCCDVHGTAQFIANHLSEDGIILMTTTLHPFPYSKDIINSWYITPRTGHVSIFSFESLFQLFRKHRINIVDSKSILVGKKIIQS